MRLHSEVALNVEIGGAGARGRGGAGAHGREGVTLKVRRRGPARLEACMIDTRVREWLMHACSILCENMILQKRVFRGTVLRYTLQQSVS